VTISSVFGIVHRDGGGARYEPGAYDVRAKVPRPTALASLARELADGRTPTHPAIGTPGFWRGPASRSPSTSSSAVVVAGATRIADRFAARCSERGLAVVRVARVDRCATALPPDPWAVIALHDGATPARRGPSDVPGILALARECEQRGVRFMTLSSDLVFDGASTRPYVESDPADPCTILGRLRRRLERRIQAVAPSALIVRVGPLLDPGDPECPLGRILAALVEGSRVRLPDDEIVSPTFVPELIDAALDLCIDGMKGIWHGSNRGALSLHALARAAALHADVSTATLEIGASLHAWGAEIGPGMRALASERASTMSAIDTALAMYVLRRDARRCPLRVA
jgi:dTDP-4-dehydrorhamnose reductase